MHTLSNHMLSIKVSAEGAELRSVYNQQTGLEYLWQAGPEWPKTSPVLFPIVGGLQNERYRYKGKEYQMGRHGFARESTFRLVDQADHSLTFLLDSNPDTLQQYPFNFSFRVKYALHDNMLSVSFIVRNSGDETMPVSVGAHPAFAVPLVPQTDYTDYLLVFNKAEDAARYLLSAAGQVETAAEPFLKNTIALPLTKDLFTNDAIVFKDLQSTSIALVSSKTSHGLKVRFGGFPYMGIWAKQGADFVCIEPWCGIADAVNTSGNLEEKEGMHHLNAQEVLERSYSVEFY